MKLVGQEYATKQCAVEAGIQDRELSLGSPRIQGICSASAPDAQQVAHLKYCKHYKFEKCRCGKCVEQRLYHNACRARMKS